jgi:hypothetical protein
MAVMPAQRPFQSKQDYATPTNFIQAAKRRLGIEEFAIDFAADATNTKAPIWWGDIANSLRYSGVEWADQPTWLYPKDCVLCLFSPYIQPGYEVWNWRKEI